MSGIPGPGQILVRHLLAEAIKASLIAKEPIGDAAVTYNVVEVLARLCDSIDGLAASNDRNSEALLENAAALDRFRSGQDDDD